MPNVLVTANDVARGKPDPEPYLLAASQLGIAASECVVVEDAPAGIQSALNAGMQVIAIATTHSTTDLTNANIIARHIIDVQISKDNSQSENGLIIQVAKM
jgi:sugar-phosphatase